MTSVYFTHGKYSEPVDIERVMEKSKYFNRMYSKTIFDKDDEVDLSTFSPSTFNIFMNYMKKNNYDLDHITFQEKEELKEIGDFLLIDEFLEFDKLKVTSEGDDRIFMYGDKGYFKINLPALTKYPLIRIMKKDMVSKKRYDFRINSFENMDYIETSGNYIRFVAQYYKGITLYSEIIMQIPIYQAVNAFIELEEAMKVEYDKLPKYSLIKSIFGW